MSIEREIYPFSTEDGKSIPLDVALPLASIYQTIAQNTETNLNIPASYDLVSLFCDIDVAVDFAGVLSYPITGNTNYSDTMLLPALTFTIIRVPATGTWRIVPLKSGQQGHVMITAIQKWAGIRLQRQLGRI